MAKTKVFVNVPEKLQRVHFPAVCSLCSSPFWRLLDFAVVDFEAPLFFLAAIFLLASCSEEKAKALFLLWALATKSLALWTALSEECCFWWLGMAFSETILPQMEHGDFVPCAAAPGGIQGLLWSCRTWCNLGREWSSSGASLIGFMFSEQVWCIKFLFALLAGIHYDLAFGGLLPNPVFSGFVRSEAVIIISSIVTSVTVKFVLPLVDGPDVLPQR